MRIEVFQSGGLPYDVTADCGDWSIDNISIRPFIFDEIAGAFEQHFGSAIWRRLCKLYGGSADIESMTGKGRSRVFKRGCLTFAIPRYPNLQSKIVRATTRNIGKRRDLQIRSRSAMTDKIARLNHRHLVDDVGAAFEAERAAHKNGLATAIIGVWEFKDADTRSLRNLHYILTGMWPT